MRLRLLSTIAVVLIATSVAGAEYPVYPSSGSTFVPLDNWVYPVFDRLAALGYMPTAFSAMRPWTRAECARLVSEAVELIPADNDSLVGPMIEELQREFGSETSSVRRIAKAEIESVYSRTTVISGTPLRDAYHFGQTLVNDSGRPYWAGANEFTGVSVRANAGPFATYFRAEYRHVPAMPSMSGTVLASVASFDRRPPQNANGAASLNSGSVLEGYAGVTLRNTQISFGKQELWWGPGRNTALLLSNNSEAFYSLRLNRTMPFKLPSVFGWLGPMRLDSFIGQLSGHRFIAPDTHNVLKSPVSQPYIHGQKISFKPTPNLEMGFSRTVIFGGPEFPLNSRTIWRSIWSTGNGAVGCDPGDRRASVDFSYRLPGLRNWVVLYSDSLAEDEAVPLLYPHRSAFNPGIYLPRLPKIANLDLRVEAVYTDPPQLRENAFFYYNLHYRDGYTNRGQLMGSWVGRQGKGLQVTSTFWITPANRILLTYRNASSSREFLSGGNTTDIGMQADWRLRRELAAKVFFQRERWSFPLLSSGPEVDWIASVQLIWSPS